MIDVLLRQIPSTRQQYEKARFFIREVVLFDGKKGGATAIGSFSLIM